MGERNGTGRRENQVDEAFTNPDLKGLSYENTFGGATSFLRRLYTKDLTGADIAVTGVPFDQAVTNRPGTRLGPRAIREASALQSPDAPYGWPFDALSELAIIDYGDMAYDYANIPAFPDTLTDHIRTILAADVASVTLGAITISASRSSRPMPRNTGRCRCCSSMPIPTPGPTTT